MNKTARYRRQEGKDGWTKGFSSWSRTGWSWEKNGRFGPGCTDCTPPKDAAERIAKVHQQMVEVLSACRGMIVGVVAARRQA